MVWAVLRFGSEISFADTLAIVSFEMGLCGLIKALVLVLIWLIPELKLEAALDVWKSATGKRSS